MLKKFKLDIRPKSDFIIDTMKEIEIDDTLKITAIIGRMKSDPNRKPFIQGYNFPDSMSLEDAKEWVALKGKSADWILGHNMEMKDGGLKIMEPIKKEFNCELKNFDDKELSFDAVASTEEIDRDGDRLMAKGWVLKNFKKNPVMLWSHNAQMLPVGRAEQVMGDDGRLTFRPKFTPFDLNPLGEQLYKLYKSGFLNAFSVRFDPIDYEDMEPKDGENLRRIGKVYKKMELLEISPVTIPANAGALIQRMLTAPQEVGEMLKALTVPQAPEEKELEVPESKISPEEDTEEMAALNKEIEDLKTKCVNLEEELKKLKSEKELSVEIDGDILELKKRLNESDNTDELLNRGKTLLGR